MDKKFKISELTAEAGQGVTNLWNKTREAVVNAADQNDDGTLDMNDIVAAASALSDGAKTAFSSLKDAAEAKGLEMERRQLKPIFQEDLSRPDFPMSKLIRIAEMDKRHAESSVCQGAIGYISDMKDMQIVNVFKSNVQEFGLRFYPDTEPGVYYIDPSDRNHYIALDEYFSYLKMARINELQKIAQELGAKHFRVIYKEQEKHFSGRSTKTKLNGKLGLSTTTEVEHDVSASEMSLVEIAAENRFPGHDPIVPELHYLERESSIQNLIAMRMDTSSPILHQRFTLKLSNSSGIKEKDAVKIDAALKYLKTSISVSVIKEVQSEARKFFEYEIDF